MSNKQHLPDILDETFGLVIKTLFGNVAWDNLRELQPDDEIVVAGNGPMRSQHGEYIEHAKMVVRCTH